MKPITIIEENNNKVPLDPRTLLLGGVFVEFKRETSNRPYLSESQMFYWIVVKDRINSIEKIISNLENEI
jgi:hypothetical protein